MWEQLKDIKQPKYLDLIKFVAFISVVLFIPSLIKPAVFSDIQSAIIGTAIFSHSNKIELIKELEEIQPDLIFIGNSMVPSRIDKTHIKKSTGKTGYIIYRGGIMSSVWYLIVKNIVAVSNVKTEAVYIFFRDTYLTEPHYRSTETFKQYIDWYSSENEEVINHILSSEKSLKYRYKDFLTKTYPLLQFNKVMRIEISIFASWMTRSIPLYSFRNFESSYANNLFQINNLRTASADGENMRRSKVELNFDRALNMSFLPYIIDVAKQNNINLVFVRVQRRPRKDAPPLEGPLLKKYISDLEKYLEDQNIGYYDFTGHPEINIDVYGPGDHLNEAGKTIFTNIFIDNIGGKLQ